MSLHFFAIPALSPHPAQEEFNRFCLSHRVVNVERHFVGDGANAYWAICVTVAAADASLPDVLKAQDSRARSNADKGRVDYKEVLNERDFAQYAALRSWRKSTAEAEGVPVCAHVRYMDDIVWWCRSRREATETLPLLRDFLWQSRKLTVKSSVQIRPSRQGLRFCGFRIRQGVVLPSSRKLSRYRAGLKRIDTALTHSMVNEQQAQRAYDNLSATLHGTQRLTFRKGLLVNDEMETDLYTIGSGCRS